MQVYNITVVVDDNYKDTDKEYFVKGFPKVIKVKKLSKLRALFTKIFTNKQSTKPVCCCANQFVVECPRGTDTAGLAENLSHNDMQIIFRSPGCAIKCTPSEVTV